MFEGINNEGEIENNMNHFRELGQEKEGRRELEGKKFILLLFIFLFIISSQAWSQRYGLSNFVAISADQDVCSNDQTTLSDITASFLVLACGGGGGGVTQNTVNVNWYVHTSKTSTPILVGGVYVMPGTAIFSQTSVKVTTSSPMTFTLPKANVQTALNCSSGNACIKYFYCVISNQTSAGSCGVTSTCANCPSGVNLISNIVTVNGRNKPFLNSGSAFSGLPSGNLICPSNSYSFAVNMSLATSYSWSVSNTTGLTLTSTSTTVNSNSVLTGSGLTNGSGYSVSVTGTGCGGTTSTQVFLTVDKPTFTTQPSTITQTVCQNGTITTLTGATGDASHTYQWYRNASASTTGGTLISGATASSYTPPNTPESSFYYYVVVTNPACSTTSNLSGLITVNGNTAISAQPSTASASACQGSAFSSALSVTGSGASLTYQWYSNTTASTTGATAISGATSATYAPSTATTGTRYYYAIVTGSCGTPSTVTSGFSGALTVNPTTAITAQPSNGAQTRCAGTAFSALALTATGASLSYQWYSNTTASTSNATTISGATTASYTPSSAGSGGLYYYATVSGSCGSATTGFSGLHSVNPTPTISTVAQDSIVSLGPFTGTTLPAKINLSGLLPGLGHSVSYSLNGTAQTPVTFTADVAGKTSFNTGNLTQVNNGATLQVTGLTISATGCAATGLSSQTRLTVSNTPRSYRSKPWNNPSTSEPTATWTNSVPGINSGACDNGTNAAAGTCYGVANGQAPVFIGHNLTIDQDVVVDNGVLYFGARGVGQKSNNLITDQTGGAAHSLTIARSGGFVTNESIVDIQSGTTTFEGALTINNGSLFIRNGATLIVGSCSNAADPGVTCTAMTIGNNSSVLIEQGGTLIVNGDVSNVNNGTGVVTVVGYLNITGDYSATAGNVNIVGSGEFVSTGSMTTSGNSSIFGSTNDCTFGPCSGTALACGGGTSYTFSLTANGQATTSAVNVCEGSALTLSFSTTAPTPIYQWQVSTVGPSTGFTNIVGATTVSYTTTPVGTAYYRMMYTPTGCGALYSNPATINVADVPEIITQPVSPGIVCQGANAPILNIEVSLLSGSIQDYKWFLTGNATPLITNASSLTSDSYTISTVTPSSGSYYAQVTTTAGCVVSSSAVAATVSAAPTSATISGTTAICNGTSANLSVAFAGSAVAPFSLTYKNSVTNEQTTVTGYKSGTAIPVTPGSTTTYTLTAASSGTAPAVCAAQSLLGSADVTVNPVPSAADLSSSYINDETTICYGTSASILANITGGTSPYSLTFSDGLTTTNYASGVAISKTPLATTNYTITSLTDANGCTGIGITGGVLVNVNNQTVWTGAALGGKWGANAANWTCGMPDLNLDAVIPNGYIVEIDNAAVVRDLTVSGSLLFNAGGLLTIHRDLFGDGPSYQPAGLAYPGCITSDAGATPKVTFAGAGNQIISGSSVMNFYDVEITNSTGWILNEATQLNIYGTLTPNINGKIDADGSTNSGVLRLRSTSGTLAARIDVIANPANFTGKVTVQRNIGSVIDQYRFVSTPVTGFTIGSELFEWTRRAFFYYDEKKAGNISTGYTSLPASYFLDATNKGLGFLSYSPPGLWEARGNLTTGTVPFNVSYTNTGFSSSDGWNMIGNPYPSAISWNPADWIMSANINPTIYVPDMVANVWAPYNYNDPLNTNLPGGVIAMGQAFWVYAPSAGPSLSVKETAKRSNQGQYLRESAGGYPILDISLRHNGISDYTHLGIHPRATSLFDNELDGPKLELGTIRVSTLSSERRNLVYDFRESVETDIPLSIHGEAGTYELVFNARSASGDFEGLYLVDLYLGSSQPLSMGKPYTFEINADPASRSERFVLSGGQNLKSEDEVMNVFPNPVRDVVQVRFRSEGPTPVTLVSSEGMIVREIMLQAVDGVVSGSLDIGSLPAGIYLIRAEVQGRMVSRKVVFQH